MKTAIIIFAAVFAFLLPIGALIWWKKKSGEKLWPFIAGAIIFTAFAMGLEQILHYFCLISDNPVSRVISGNVPLYALYGGLAAGIFEECGRFFGFKTLLRNHNEREVSIAYGIGHGGIEVILILGMAYVFYSLFALGVPMGDAATEELMAQNLASIQPAVTLTACLERVIAMALHVGLSMIVFKAARGGGIKWLFIAIAIHAITDIPAVFCQQGQLPIWVIEVWCTVMAALALKIGLTLYKGMAHQNEAAETIIAEPVEVNDAAD